MRIVHKLMVLLILIGGVTQLICECSSFRKLAELLLFLDSVIVICFKSIRLQVPEAFLWHQKG